MNAKRTVAPPNHRPDSEYALVVNANPMTGIPAVLGELAQDIDALDTCGVSWRRLRTVPLYELSHQRPELYQKVVALAQGWQMPTQFLLHFFAQDLELLRAQPLTLSPTCALRYFSSILEGGRIGTEEFLRAIPAEAISPRRAHLDPQHNGHLISVTHGTPISGGPAKGVLVKDQGRSRLSALDSSGYIVLVDRIEAHHTTLLNDSDCTGVLALRGSPVDHFALLSREKGFPYMVLERHSMNDIGLRCPGTILPFGAVLTIDFSTGQVYVGDGVLNWEPETSAVVMVQQLLATQVSPIPLRLNLDTADDIHDGFPAEAIGIGLLRTEHMLRRSNMQGVLRQFLESDDAQAQKQSLSVLSSFFQREFARCFVLARGLPVTIRLLDYPLHELGGRLSTEVNPMLGLRGVRQGMQWPELYLAQIEAILHAACSARQQEFPWPDVEVLVPVVNFLEEVCTIRRWIEQCQHALPSCQDLAIKVGAMIETPAAALAAESLAIECDFLSFGTNDLTQLALGLSREDYPPVLWVYRQRRLLRKDPFHWFQPTVLQMVREAAQRAKQARQSITIGLCGAHAADPQTLELCKMGLLDYLSVSRHQLPRVKLQAIQVLGR